MSAKLNTAVVAFEELKNEFNKKTPDDAVCGKILNKLKLLLAELGLLSPVNQIPDIKERLIAREFLEYGALWSIRAMDIPSFERYVTQLKGHYSDFSEELPKSQKQHMLLGLNLMRLLAQNRIAEFHTELELIDPKLIHEDLYIKHAVELEQCLMEGSYNKVVKNREVVPANEFLFFIDILVDTIRQEIAKCAEKAYESLPLSSAAKLLYFTNQEQLLEFASARGWETNVQAGIINFHKDSKALSRGDISSQAMIANTLLYARELEKIV